MRIAQVAPLYESVPPIGYGGTERVVGALADALVDGGHDVTLFAAGGSSTRAKCVEVVPEPLRSRMNREEMLEVAPHIHLRMLADIYDRACDFDVIHSHVDIWTLPLAHHSATPTVLTMHGRLDLDQVRQAVALYPDVPLVSISDHQRLALRGVPVHWAATVHNGLDLARYHAAQRSGGEYLAFVGRINPEKGPALAVEIARRAKRQLRVAAKIDPHRGIVVNRIANNRDICRWTCLGNQRDPIFMIKCDHITRPCRRTANRIIVCLSENYAVMLAAIRVTGRICTDVVSLDQVIAAAQT